MSLITDSSSSRSFYVETERMRFHCRAHGDEGGVPMLLIHGSYATSRWWEPLFAVLPDDVYAVAPDLRGCGASDKTDAGYTVEEQADDLRALVQALGWSQFDLLGHSSGGAIAVEFALAHTELLTTLLLIDSVPPEGVFTPLDTMEVLAALREDRSLLTESLALLMPTYVNATDGYTQDEFFRHVVDDAAAMAPPLFTALAESLNEWNRMADVSKLTLPCLVVWGEQDALVSRDAATRTLIALPGANNLEVLRGVGHSPMIEAPLTLAERIINFVTDSFEEFAEIRESVEEEETHGEG